MDASNPLSIAQAASPSLSTVLSPSAQSGGIASPAIKAPEVPALTPAAALQYQFNVQQSLLMQQYAFAQQAAVKAATVKSAAEVAAARAAEISKQLEKKSQSSSTSKSTSRSPSRSKSKSRSKSRSRSRSRSRSPIRKRRDRSYSRSPIRYRRDYHSSYRPRDHYRYRGYNYRSYYRGSYNDYSRYRYERDHYRRRSRSRGARRSRTRSRSRSKSRSPRRERSRGRRRSQSISPPARNRSRTRSPRDLHKKSLSPHVRRDGTKSGRNPLRSESRDAKRSLSVSSRSIRSPTAKSRNRSSSPVKAEGGDKSPSTELSHGMGEDRLAFVDRKPQRESSISSHGRRQSSSSTIKSLSLDHQSNGSAPDKAAAKRSSSSDRPVETVKAQSSDDNEGTSKRTSSDELVSHGKVVESEGWNKTSGGGQRNRKPMGSPNAIFRDESESSDESLDDWRDDLKQVEKGKSLMTQKDGEPDRLEGRNRNGMDSFVKTIANDEEPKHELILPDDSSEHNDSANAVREQDVTTYQGYGPATVCGDKESLRGESRRLSVSENAEVCKEGVQFGQIVDEDVVFEGPKPASPVFEHEIQRCEAAVTDERSPIAKWSTPEKKAIGSPRIVEDDKHRDKRHSRERKVRDTLKSRDGKKYEGELMKHEKHRDRHKKHRKKHRYVDDESAERDGARRRHKRKHRREDEHGNKERKKRKHKHRTRSSSVSAEDSSSDSESEIRSRKRRKRGSKKLKAAKGNVLESPHLSASQG